MTTIYVNAATTHIGGSVTYLRSFISTLTTRSSRFKYVLLVNSSFDHGDANSSNVATIPVFKNGSRPSFASRASWDQLGLRRYLTDRPALLFSPANVALFKAPIPQTLLLRQSLYLSRHFTEGILPKRSQRSQLEERLRWKYIKASIRAARVVIVPSLAMATALRTVLGVDSVAVPYATDLTVSKTPPAWSRAEPFTFIYPSHYADYKNFRGLLTAARLLRKQGYEFRLKLNASPETFPRYVSAWLEDDLKLFSDRDLQCVLVRVGPQDRAGIRHSLAGAQALVMPSFSESFGHPFLEAMSHGLPIAASDIEVAREIAGPAALYFDPWEPEQIAKAMARLMDDAALRQQLGRAGLERVSARKWHDYVTDLENVWESLGG